MEGLTIPLQGMARNSLIVSETNSAFDELVEVIDSYGVAGGDR
jgi:hypothetical protein